MNQIKLTTNCFIEAKPDRIVSFSRARGSVSDEGENDEDTDDDDERLASLEALRYALHHAPFVHNLHMFMTIPDESSLAWQGLPTKCAIRIEHLSYRNILDDINMEVPKGKIYALLGCDNSGKSTLLKCITGRVRPTNGSVLTFGTQTCKTALSAICVGFMPQTVSLHQELNIIETLKLYGRLYQLPLYLILDRIKLLCSMLHLPNQCVPIRELNPGQKWRVSLAIALIHSPPLLLLDEPTVMVDPLIRRSVWNRLQRLCEEEGLTVLVTTKYPEEVGFSYKVGLMRNGHIYDEDCPEDLLTRYNCTTYDQLYSTFCEQNIPRTVRPSVAPYQGSSLVEVEHDNKKSQTNLSGQSLPLDLKSGNHMFPILERLQTPSSVPCCSTDSTPKKFRSQLSMAEWPICERRRTAYITKFIDLDWKRLLTLVMKNVYIMRGNLTTIIIFYFLFPVLQMIFTCFIFGRTVRQLPISVSTSNEFTSAHVDKFVSTFVQSFLDKSIFMPKYGGQQASEAIDKVRKGKTWAAITPWSSNKTNGMNEKNSQNFSSQTTTINQIGCDNQKPFGIKLHLDQSNYVISQTMFYSFISSMRAFLRSNKSLQIYDCIEKLPLDEQSQTVQWYQSGIDIQEVIYGSTKFRFLEFLLPGFLVAFVFTYSLVLSAYLFIKEHMAGLQERCLATGTSGIEILISHYISQIGLYLMQQTIILIIVFRFFGLPSRGPFYALWLLIFLQGLAGISFGLFVAVICPRPIGAALFTSAIVIPAFFFSGIIWPIESMNHLAQYFSHSLPLTLPINSLRYIISRGSDMHYNQIIIGFSISAGYIGILLLLTIVIFKCKTSS